MATESRELSSKQSGALVIALIAGLAGAWGGPWLIGHRDRAAKEPFGYALPEGFNPVPSAPGSSSNGHKAYAHAPLGQEGLVPNLTIAHVNDMSVFDDAKLVEIAAGMPQFFAESKIKWTEVRHAQVKRQDGALVGLLEGENTIAETRFRCLQLSFPDNTGVSLVTCNFPSTEAAHWEPIFESTIETSRGVATRGAVTPLWMRVAWGVGSFLVALLVALSWAKRPAPSAAPPPGPVDAPPSA
jgi:hypothetical protein